MISNFTYRSDPIRIVFGAGAVAALRAETEFHKISRLVVLCSPTRADFARRVTAPVADRCVGFCDTAGQHMPRDAFERIIGEMKRFNADGFIVIGGGSPIGLAKAVAATTGLPYVAIVTTYSGSEMAARWYIGVADNRVNGESVAALPATAIYDPELTLDLPPAISAASGMNAMAHCVEALYAHDGNPIISLMAEEGIRALASALPRIVSQPKDLEARSNALYGSWLAGATISTTSVALHHKLCHVLGGFGLPHAETHSIVLPHAVRYNRDAVPEAMARISKGIGTFEPATGLFDLESKLGIPMRLADIGMKEADLERAARIAAEAPYPNPRKVEYEPVLALLRDAYRGLRPVS